MTPSESAPGSGLARLIVGHVCLHAAMSGARMASPLLALSQGCDKTLVGLLVALFAVAQVFLALPAGRFADRRGLRAPVAYSIAAVCGGNAIAAAWPIYPVLCVNALLTGGAVGVASIALQRHVGRAAQNPVQLRHAFSWLSLAPAASGFIGPLLAGVAIDRLGYRAAYLLLAVLAATVWPWMRAARDLPNEQAGTGATTAWSLWREPAFRRLMLMNGLFMASWDLHAFLVPVLGHERGLQASVIGSILGSFAVAAAIVRMMMPAISSRLPEWALITTATAATGFVFLVYPLTVSPLSMGLCSALIGMTLGGVQPMIMSMLHQITPPDRHGQAVAMRLMMVNVSSVAMPMLFGTAGGLMGVSAVFWATGLMIGLGSGFGFGLRGLGREHGPGH